MVTQMRKIPLKRALILQNDIQGLLTQERLHYLSNAQAFSRSLTPNSTPNTLPCYNSTWNCSSDTSSAEQPTVHVDNIGETKNSCEADILTQASTTINMRDLNN